MERGGGRTASGQPASSFIGLPRIASAGSSQALREFIARREQARLVDLFGTLAWDPGFDHKHGAVEAVSLLVDTS